MRLYATSEAQAKAFADRAHVFLVQHDSGYAASVGAGQTERWAFPSCDRGEDGRQTSDWFIPFEPRCAGAFNETELARVDPPLPKPENL